ncbi:7077_t:CDS:2 [Gigaspora margarita]|uniref:7077_t:CDS:1 n=1 Tax=Gigaspora margarita TaxID=4874 RepID=A0ABN7UX38_GIGMA|nr:7077_t:CDS:2 [Gigaspora margarita]
MRRGVTCLKNDVIGDVVGNKFSLGAIDEANLSEDKIQVALTFLISLDNINRNPIELPLYPRVLASQQYDDYYDYLGKCPACNEEHKDDVECRCIVSIIVRELLVESP